MTIRPSSDGLVSVSAARLREGRRRAAVAVWSERVGVRDREVCSERAWSDLLLGGWCLVDLFELAGRRYLIACRRRHAVGALTRAELACALLVASGRSPKAASIELGVHASTTSTHLRRAMKKLGISRRADLVAALGGQARRAESSSPRPAGSPPV